MKSEQNNIATSKVFTPPTGGGQKPQDYLRMVNEHESLAQKINMAVKQFDEHKSNLDKKLGEFKKDVETTKPDYLIETKY